MARSRRDPATYEVGYAKPPKATRFPAGRSGNPRGRPKGSRSVGAVLQAILHQKINVTENGRTRKVAVLEVLIRRLASDAMRSDPRALKLLLSLADRVPGSVETAPDLGAIMDEDAAILRHYVGSLPTAIPEDQPGARLDPQLPEPFDDLRKRR